MTTRMFQTLATSALLLGASLAVAGEAAVDSVVIAPPASLAPPETLAPAVASPRAASVVIAALQQQAEASNLGLANASLEVARSQAVLDAARARFFPELSLNARYTRADGSLCSEADYAGVKTLLDALRLMLTQRLIHVHLQFLPPLACAGRHRRELAHDAARLIAAALNVPVPLRRTGKASRPPV